MISLLFQYFACMCLANILHGLKHNRNAEKGIMECWFSTKMGQRTIFGQDSTKEDRLGSKYWVNNDTF